MQYSKLKRAQDYEVQSWILNNIPEITPYQRSKIQDMELVRLSPFTFFKDREKKKVSVLMRVTILFLPVYIVLVWCTLPFNFLFTGHWHLNQKFIEKFHLPWMNKIGL